LVLFLPASRIPIRGSLFSDPLASDLLDITL